MKTVFESIFTTRRPIIAVLFSVLVALLSACSGSSSSSSDITVGGEPTTDNEPSLVFTTTVPPLDVGTTGGQFTQNISYGTDSLQTFDIFLLPDSSEPTPLVIFYHGGGFTGGDKTSPYSSTNAARVSHYLNNGIAFASVNYRLLEEVDAEGVIKPLLDTRKALQFIRHHSLALNVDPDKIALQGGSAGAGAALWIGFSDDMALPNDADLIARESTRVSAIAVTETQSTYDLLKWETEIFLEYGFTLEQAISQGLEQRLLSFYGIDSIDEINSPAVEEYRSGVDMLDLLTADDPEIWVENKNQPLSPPTTTGILFHHANHALALKDQADLMGLNGIFYIPKLGITDDSGETLEAFLTRKLLNE